MKKKRAGYNTSALRQIVNATRRPVVAPSRTPSVRIRLSTVAHETTPSPVSHDYARFDFPHMPLFPRRPRYTSRRLLSPTSLLVLFRQCRHLDAATIESGSLEKPNARAPSCGYTNVAGILSYGGLAGGATTTSIHAGFGPSRISVRCHGTDFTTTWTESLGVRLSQIADNRKAVFATSAGLREPRSGSGQL